MEWHVKKSCCHKKAARLYIVLCDSGGSLKQRGSILYFAIVVVRLRCSLRRNLSSGLNLAIFFHR
ncbi:hypothetical protein G7Z93_01965 [Citrobacter freundii]|nr:hypothetical protein [Citrobacter freundii]HCB1462453.1 hypothetical protein [Citrobacter freundii]